MYVPQIILEGLGWLSYGFLQLQPLLPTYAHLVASAVFPIYAGAYSSLSRPSSAARPEKKKSKNERRGMMEEDEEEHEHRMEGLSPTDAIVFPVLAGCTLAGLYFLIKWLQDPTLLNKFLNWYFAFFSVFSVSRLVSDGLDVVHSVSFPHHYIDRGQLFTIEASTRRAIATHERQIEYRRSPLPGIFSRLPLPQRVANLLFWLHVLPAQKLTFKAFVRNILSVKLRLGIHGTVGLIAGLGSVLYYNFVGKPWFLTNLMGFGFAYGALQLMSPTTFWTGTLILSALFFYDIYFVFFTPMMVTVAKSLDVPIKLLFPRPAEPDADPGVQAMSMLGLGDVVLPGMMVGLALRFDLFMFYLRKQTKFSSPPISDSHSHSESESKSEGSNKIEDGASPSKPTTDQIIKAPYQAVSGGWGDRVWTSSVLGKKPVGFSLRGEFPKPYFRASLAGYVLGMLTTLGAMQVSDHPQPALLYLVPGVRSWLWGAAWLRGEIREMWEYSEASGEEDEANEGGAGGSKKATGPDDAEGKSKDGQKDKKSQSSIFSYSRAEQRSRRLEDAMNKKSSTDTIGADDSEDGDAKASTGGPMLVSFSIRAPPPPFRAQQQQQLRTSPGSGSAKKGEHEHENEDDSTLLSTLNLNLSGSGSGNGSSDGASPVSGSDDANREHIHKRARIT